MHEMSPLKETHDAIRLPNLVLPKSSKKKLPITLHRIFLRFSDHTYIHIINWYHDLNDFYMIYQLCTYTEERVYTIFMMIYFWYSISNSLNWLSPCFSNIAPSACPGPSISLVCQRQRWRPWKKPPPKSQVVTRKPCNLGCNEVAGRNHLNILDNCNYMP